MSFDSGKLGFLSLQISFSNKLKICALKPSKHKAPKRQAVKKLFFS
jgi:hypothetical protein